jgi:MFS family permease
LLIALIISYYYSTPAQRTELEFAGAIQENMSTDRRNMSTDRRIMSTGTNRFRAIDYFKITALAIALAGLGNGMHAIILPLRVQELAGQAQQSTYLGLITFVGLVVAILVQPVAGTISDHSGFRWGRRRPFILVGIGTAIFLLVGFGFAGDFVVLFIIWCLIQASLNIAQGPYQAFIPDLVPEGNRGLASGVKGFLEILGGVALLRIIGYFMERYNALTGEIWFWRSLGTICLVLVVTLLITLIFVKESPGKGSLKRIDSSLIFQSFRINLRTNSKFVLYLFSRLLFMMALTTIQTFALYYFQDVIKIPNAVGATSNLITTVGIAMLIVVYPAGRFSDKIGRQPILAASGFLAAAGTGLIFFFHNYQMVLFAGVLIGIATGAFLSTSFALATDLIPPGEAARYLGLANLASAGGGALARLIGPVIDFFNGQTSGLGYSVMLGATFVYFLVSSFMILRIKVVQYQNG